MKVETSWKLTENLELLIVLSKVFLNSQNILLKKTLFTEKLSFEVRKKRVHQMNKPRL